MTSVTTCEPPPPLPVRACGGSAAEDGPLDFSTVYGIINEPAPSIPLYDGRRMWRVYDLLAPSLKLDPRWGFMLLPGRPTCLAPARPPPWQQLLQTDAVAARHHGC